MKFLKTSVIILLAAILATPCFAQMTPEGVPKLIQYSGELSKPNGSPYPAGIYDINFSICTDADCTTSIWTEIHTVEISAKNKRDLDGGSTYQAAFLVLLGSVSGLDLAFETDYYLHITEAIWGHDKTEQLMSTPYAMRGEFANYAETAYDSNDETYKDIKAIKVSNAFEADNADTLDGKHYSDIANEIDDDIATHASENTNTHGVTGEIVGTTDEQTLTNKHISGEQIDSGEISDARIPNDITINYAANAGYASSAGNADTVDGKHYSDILNDIDAHAKITAVGFTYSIGGCGYHTWDWPYPADKIGKYPSFVLLRVGDCNDAAPGCSSCSGFGFAVRNPWISIAATNPADSSGKEIQVMAIHNDRLSLSAECDCDVFCGLNVQGVVFW